MSESPFRLPADAPHGFGGSELDRARPLRFRLNGRRVEGFAGDTVLSAALASGILSAGRHGDDPLGLDERFAPPVMLAGGEPLPMERTPAVDGLDLVTVGARRDPIASRGLLGALRNRLVGPARTLNHRYGGDAIAAAPPWLGRPPAEVLEADFVVVGGGVAGMTAAAAAAGAGRSVVLVERDFSLGGNAAFFGAVDAEEAPEAAIARLGAELAQRGNVRILCGAEALGFAAGRLDLHQVDLAGGRPRGRNLAIAARHVVLATGALERLPVFPGNRSPGIVGTLAAFRRATRFGLWTGRRTLFNAPHSLVYRLALYAADAGIAVQRVTDARLGPASRFIDFCKASGITLASGLIVSHAVPLRRNQPGLGIGFAVAIDEISQDATPLETDLLVAGGGFQPDLALWLAAGGGARWDAANRWLAPAGTLDAIAVVGSAAGWRSTSAAMASARAAVLAALGKAAPAPVDRIIDPLFESADAPTPVAPFRESARGAAAFLDIGPSFVTRRIAAAGRHGVSQLAAEARAIGLCDVAAAVQVGTVAEPDAGSVAAERCVVGAEIADTGWHPPPAGPTEGVPELPAYLAGRFGPRPLMCVVAVADSRFFEPGCLVFERSETTDPREALGVVFAAAPGGRSGGLAVLARAPEALGTSLYVRDSSGPVPVEVMERLRPGK